MTSKTKIDEERTAKAIAKELRSRDAELAMREYQLERLAVAAKTERLRALRLSQNGRVSSEVRRQSGASKRPVATDNVSKERNG